VQNNIINFYILKFVIFKLFSLLYKNKLTKVEAGAQGDHKLSRGYIPTATNSMHWIENPSFRNAIENYLDQERTIIGKDMEYLNKLTPFKNSKK